MGIGTSAPLSPAAFATIAHINGASSASYVVSNGSSYRGEFGISSNGAWLSTADAIPLRMATSGAERMRITAAGNVGIGITTPQSKLDVSAPGITNFQSTTNGALTIRDDSNTTNYHSTIDFTSLAGAADGILPIARIGVKTDSAAGSTMYFGTSNTLLGITNTALTINTGGNVGIGTTAPGAKLDVKDGNIATSGTGLFDLGLQRVSNSCNAAGWDCTATCPAGKYIVTGGCQSSGIPFDHNFPNSNSGWLCRSTTAGLITAYAVCGKVVGF